jgi:hypothetical protein
MRNYSITVLRHLTQKKAKQKPTNKQTKEQHKAKKTSKNPKKQTKKKKKKKKQNLVTCETCYCLAFKQKQYPLIVGYIL